MSKKTKIIILLVLMFSFIPLFSLNGNKIEKSINGDSLILPDTKMEEIVDSFKLYNDSIKNELVLEVRKYVYSVSNNVNKDIPFYFVEHSLNHNIDLIFMMAQSQIETSFGTTGIGREISKKSLFGVMKSYKYKTYDEAINDYCLLLKKSYLGTQKTEQQLMKNYVNLKGARYAGNPNYEKELQKTYKTIDFKTNIKDLFKQYKNKLVIYL